MNILIVSGSPRKGGNTDIMAETFREEVVKKGHQAELVSLSGKDRLEAIRIKGKFDYNSLNSLSNEARQKLMKIDPETLAQASRIPGISPSDINVLLVLLGR